MILESKHVKEKIEDIKNETYKYLIADVEHILYEDDQERFGFSVEALNLINTINNANRLCENLGSEKKIDTDVLYKVIDAIMLEKSLSNSELKQYFELVIKLDEFYKSMDKYQAIDVHIPFDAEFILLGLSQDELRCLSASDKNNLNTSYGDLYIDLIRKRITVNEYILKAKDLIENRSADVIYENAKKEALEEHKKVMVELKQVFGIGANQGKE